MKFHWFDVACRVANASETANVTKQTQQYLMDYDMPHTILVRQLGLGEKVSRGYGWE